MDSTQIESQGGQLRVEVTVLRADNIPRIKAFGVKREYFVTIAYGATTKKIKKKTRNVTVQIEGQTAFWNQTLDPFFVQPSSHLILFLYAKRVVHKDLLIGTHDTTVPTESERGSFLHCRILVYTAN
jgi:hypothetical protein